MQQRNAWNCNYLYDIIDKCSRVEKKCNNFPLWSNTAPLWKENVTWFTCVSFRKPRDFTDLSMKYQHSYSETLKMFVTFSRSEMLEDAVSIKSLMSFWKTLDQTLEAPHDDLFNIAESATLSFITYESLDITYINQWVGSELFYFRHKSDPTSFSFSRCLK